MPLTEAMRRAFGYDDFGTSERLLAETDRQAIDAGEYVRVAGESECTCGLKHRLHPPVQGALWLIRSCEGLVKL